MRKIKIIIPVSSDKINKTTLEQVEALGIGNYSFDVEHLPSGPVFLSHRYLTTQAIKPLVALALKAEKDNFDGIFISLFNNDVEDIVREAVSIPVVSAFRPALLTVQSIANRYGIITVLSNFEKIIAQQIRVCGLDTNMVGLTHIPYVKDQTSEMTLQYLFEKAQLLIEKGAQAIVLGCTGMVGLKGSFQQRLQLADVNLPIIDATESAVCMLTSLIQLELSQSRLTYGDVAMFDD